MRTILLISALLICNVSWGISGIDDGYTPPDSVFSYDAVETKPAPEDGMIALYKKWNSLAKYPKDARRNSIEGRVFLSFVVSETGELTDIKVEEGLGHGCDEEAMNALKETGLKWVPGTIDGRKVKVRMILPFTFRLT